MGDLNVPHIEADALKAIDTRTLSDLVAQCIREEQISALRAIRLEDCGPYVASTLRSFEQALAAHLKAKAPKKRTETGYTIRKTGSDLEHAVSQMKDRIAAEEQEGLLFFVEDNVKPPFSFSEQLRVRVNYRWRENVDGEWNYGSSTFSHSYIPRPGYLERAPAKKASAAKRANDLQEVLYQQWEYLTSLSLQAIREHFRKGGTSATVPAAVQASTDPQTGSLNNFSVRF
ncbi:MAG: hypothetical protein M3N82_00505 [Pseudomonadota bacterium]|nr:hypothetical protein [Pseudomonadota bacterium]